VRVPFIAAWGKASAENAHQKRLPIAAGAVQTQLAAVYDIYPTLLGLTGAANPAAHVLDGRPLDTLLTGKRDEQHEEAFLMHYPHAPHRTHYFTTYREGAWKVIYHYFPTEVSEGGHYQLYNLQDDPFEQKNLAATHPVELKRLMTAMVAKLEAQGAVYPVEKGTATPVKPKLP
jgi:arylsulfatase A-like enzyme